MNVPERLPDREEVKHHSARTLTWRIAEWAERETQLDVGPTGPVAPVSGREEHHFYADDGVYQFEVVVRRSRL